VTAPNEVDQDQAAAAAAQLDPDEQLRLLSREIKRVDAEDATAAKQAPAHGGPCRYCGATLSWEVPDVVGGWLQTEGQPVCWACARERGGPAGDDRAHRVKACDQVLGDILVPDWAPDPGRLCRRAWHEQYKAQAMVWWFEVAGARPGRGAERYGYISAAELRDDRLYKGRKPQPPKLEKGPRCPRCRAKDRWLVTERPVSGEAYTVGDKISRPYVEVRRVCYGRNGACRYEPEPERRYT
jgi:hypothetical protein